jgi:ParB/RepB/Spo0J family partition protein
MADSNVKTYRPIDRKDISIKKILRDINQPRKEFKTESINTLASNIKKNGILVPLVVMPLGPDKKDQYLLIDGERRHRAAQKIGLKMLPCVIMAKVEGFDLDAMRFAIHQQREDWSPYERADALYQMKQTYDKSLQELSRDVGMSEQTVRQYLGIREMPQSVQDRARNNSKKFKISYLTEMRGAMRSLDDEWRAKFPNAEDIVAEKIEKDIIKTPIDLRDLKKIFKKNDPVTINRFFKDEDYTIEEAYIQSGKATEDFEKNIHIETKHLIESLETAFEKDLYNRAQREFVSDLDKLFDLIQQFLTRYKEKQEEELDRLEKMRKFREKNPDFQAD